MRIKTTKHMRLDELLKNVWDGDLPAKAYASDRFKEIVNVKKNGVDFGELKFGDMHKNTTYTVDVEEELTEDTKFEELWVLSYNRETQAYHIIRGDYLSIIESKGRTSIEGLEAFAIYHKDTLIWSKDTGIPAEGVIEV